MPGDFNTGGIVNPSKGNFCIRNCINSIQNRRSQDDCSVNCINSVLECFSNEPKNILDTIEFLEEEDVKGNSHSFIVELSRSGEFFDLFSDIQHVVIGGKFGSNFSCLFLDHFLSSLSTSTVRFLRSGFSKSVDHFEGFFESESKIGIGM